MVSPRHCNWGETSVGYHAYLAGCRKDCERGFGFRCGGYWYACNNGVFQVLDINEGSCPEAVQGDYDRYTYVNVPITHPDSPRVYEMNFELLSKTKARIIFLEELPQDELSEYPYLEIENDHMRWDHPGYQFTVGGPVYSYFQILEGDYFIDTSKSTYGTVEVDIYPY